MKKNGKIGAEPVSPDTTIHFPFHSARTSLCGISSDRLLFSRVITNNHFYVLGLLGTVVK